ncbi:MAG: AMP-binding protein [Paludibacter sp.]|jgi:long-chain acyl-CoA synthetase|nr:AMP-binding protein [Paludibacter sp.]
MTRPTIIDLFNTSVDKFSENVFLWEKTGSKFEPTTYSETRRQVHHIAAGLLSLGVKNSDKVALLSEGRNAWIVGELGILLTGAISVPLSIKLEESNDLIFRLVHSETKYIVVSGGQLKKIRKIIGDLPLVKKIIVFDEQPEYQPLEISLNDVIKIGEEYLAKNPDSIQKSAAEIKPDDVATISYTSGTTADPKGVLLTHRNYTGNVEQAMSLIYIPPTYRTLIILPLDHCFAHVAGFYSFMAYGASVGTVQNGKTGMETLKNIPINIKELKPDILLSVPSLAKNFRKNIESNIRQQGKTIEKLFNFAMKTAYEYNKEGFNKGGGWKFWQRPLLAIFDKVLFTKIRAGFGGNLKFFVGGGALLDIELQRFFYAVGMPMYQGYGLSEATPIISSNGLIQHKLGSSGFLVQPMDLKICDLDGNELPLGVKGEIVIKGENVMAGYYKNPTATAETVVDGWLHTGDMGYMDKDGFLYVVGRFKSLLIASDGEKYSPEGIEESLADNSKFIEQAILHNNQDPYTSALIVPNKEALKSYVKEKGLDWKTKEAKIEALNKLQAEINEYKKDGRLAGTFPDRWLPAAVAVIGEPFTEQNGLMNSTMKIVRGKVEQRYEDRLKQLYLANYKEIINDVNIEALS